MSNGFDALLDGELSEAQGLELLTFLATVADVATPLTQLVQALRLRMTPVCLSKPAIDVCGTGGSGGSRFNVSTVSAFALAAIGIPVAKHGNRGSRVSNGSFDFLEALDIPIDLDAKQAAQVFSQTDLTFLFARQFHPAMRHVASLREKFGQRTLFNLAGPLCNPASVYRQCIGTISNEAGSVLATVLQNLGMERAIVVVGPNTSDELMVRGRSSIIEVTPHQRATYEIDPTEFVSANPIVGGDAHVNADRFVKWLDAPSADPDFTAMVALGCAAGMVLVDHSPTFKDAYISAFDMIKSGVVAKKVAAYRTAAKDALAG